MKTIDKTPYLAQSTNTSSGYSAEVGTNESVTATHQDGGDATLGFFVVGAVVNIVMIIAYFIWAYKNWNNKSRDKKV